MESGHKALNKVSIATLMVALGIIYGDIGTSPLYALRAVIGDRPISELLVYGGVSCIFWTLVFQTSVKYIWITLQADNQGEGGVFSLYALVRRYSKYLVIPTILGATTLLADGIITPPISVASAIEGLGSVKGLENVFVAGNNLTVGIVVAILSLLFFFQRFGTQSIGKFFGPVMFLWFLMLFVIGGSQILLRIDVLKALNPYYAYSLLTQYPKGFWLLGAVFLCTTGAEALYSDLGHCGIKNIRITWMFVKVSLVASYLGQAAYIMHSGRTVMGGDNPFFAIMPEWFLLPSIILATLATIIASQALISGSFTLISEAVHLNFWPRVSMRQPTEIKGQVYIPSVNTILWIGCVLMIVYFKTSTHMEAAYGFSITVAMLMTTYLLYFYLNYIKKWSKLAIVLLMLVFVVVESSFFIANVAKIKERWMFLFFELFIFLTMYIWYKGRKVNNRFVKFVDLGKYATALQQLSADTSIPKFSTHLVYLTKANTNHEVEEKIVNSILSRQPKRADVYWLLHIHRTAEPYTMEYDVVELVAQKVIKININLGFRVQPKTELYYKKILQELIAEKQMLPESVSCGAKYCDQHDFKFVVIEKFLSVENEFTLKDGLLLQTYMMLRQMAQQDEKAFGLDKSDVVTEYVPIVYQSASVFELKRVVNKKALQAN